MHMKVRLLVAIREMKISRCHDFARMSLAALCASAVSEDGTTFEVQDGSTGGFHHCTLKCHLLIAGKGGVQQ